MASASPSPRPSVDISPHRHDALTIISMAVIASGLATLLHEGIGHGLVAVVRGDLPTELTSTHLSSLYPDRVVQASGTLVNLAAGTASVLASARLGARANPRYFFWLLGALNLLPGAGYFMFSGVFGFGDWNAVIQALPDQFAWRLGMTAGGALLYVLVVRTLAITIKPFVPDPAMYNTVGRVPYYAAGAFSCVAGLFDPLGIRLLIVSTIPAAFGGSSGLLWADSLVPRKPEPSLALVVRRQIIWWIAALVLGGTYIAVLGPGIRRC